MSEPPKPDDVARKFLDLWERQLALSGSDREFAEIAAKAVEFMTSGFAAMQAFGQTFAQAHPLNVAAHATAHAHDAAASSRASAPRPPSDGSGPDLDELARRLADVEKRLARLEPKSRGRGKGSRRRTPKR